MAKKINVSVRRDKTTGRPVLFFYNKSNGGYWLECYDRQGQHSEASKAYMRLQTVPISHSPEVNPDAAALVREWETLGPESEHSAAHCVARLPVPRDLSYIGK